MNRSHNNHRGLAATMTFIAIFAPMILNNPSIDRGVFSFKPSSPATADALETQLTSPLIDETTSLGQGGPIDALINPPEESNEPQSKPRKIIDRYNKLNYSNAIWPVDPPEVSSDFGWRTPPCDGCSADHKGTDFVPGRGADVVAVLDGLVVEAGILGGYGTWVKLEHRVPSIDTPGEYETWETVYAHLQTNSIPEEVGVGSIVKQGDLLGLVGNTGQSTGDHLHFEIKVNDEHQNPFPLLATYQVIEYMPDGSEEFIRFK